MKSAEVVTTTKLEQGHQDTKNIRIGIGCALAGINISVM